MATLPRPPKPDLEQLVYEEKLSTRAIASLYDVHDRVVARWLDHYGIPRQRRKYKAKGKATEYDEERKRIHNTGAVAWTDEGISRVLRWQAKYW